MSGKLASWGALLVLVAATGAQQPPATDYSPPQEPPTVRAEAREVRLTLTASDPLGRPVALGAPDVQIAEDGRPVGPLSAFFQGSDRPLDLALLLDASASTNREFAFEKRVLGTFLGQVMRGSDRGMVVSFADRAEVVAESTGDVGRLQRALAAVQPKDESTRLFDAVSLAAASFAGAGERRRVIVVISDGDDTASLADLVMALEAAQRADAVIYAIGLQLDTDGAAVLRSLAGNSGGQFFAARRDADLQRAFADIDAELREQYIVTFRPLEDADGRYHALRATTARPGVRLRTRSGYFATQ